MTDPIKGGDATAAVPSEIPQHSQARLPATRLSRCLDAWLIRIGRAASWLWLALVIVILGNVVLRYSFGEGRIELEELQWHLYAVGFLVALSMAVATDDHIRVDILHERMSLRQRAWVEVYGTLLLLMPFLLLVLIYAIPFAAYSLRSGEVSQAPGGLPMRWLIKAALPLGFLLLTLAAVARLSRATALLFGFPAALPATATDADRVEVRS
ncbi:MAG: TRAP transporter small permease subunit [Gammaproteobacteria bacterium]|nr:MAG: TRAP transporter small permease subunit [Gammaproteobacteria bacterium]